MRIITNAIPLLSPLTGVGIYIQNLLEQFMRLRPEFYYSFFYGYFSDKVKCYSGQRSYFVDVKTTVNKIPSLTRNLRDLKDFLSRLHLDKYDLYFEPNFIPLNIRAKKTITTVYDFSFHLHPEWHPRDRIEYFEKLFFKRLQRSDALITISSHVEKEALEILNIPESLITAIPLGYDSSKFNPSPDMATTPDTDDKYILFVGSIEPRKNLLRLLKAYSTLPEGIRKEFKLCLVGFKGWENRDVMDLMERLKGSIDYLGYVTLDELAELYRKASCFVYPSLYEGFGLPPLEAMACGCPVVVSDVASLPEVCGDAALYVDPLDIESIADGLLKVLSSESLRDDLRTRGLKRATMFSWEKCALEHLELFDRVMAS